MKLARESFCLSYFQVWASLNYFLQTPVNFQGNIEKIMVNGILYHPFACVLQDLIKVDQ